MDDFDARRASLDLVTAFVNNNALSAGELPALLRDVFTAISGFESKALSTAQPGEGASAAHATEPTPALVGKLIEVTSLGADDVVPTTAAKAPAVSKPAVSVRQSLADPTVIVSLITGESFKMLKRHLTKHGLTEAEYKARFNLPDDYPTVAPAYAEVRRKIAAARHAKSKRVESGAPFAAAPAAEAEQLVAKPSKAKPGLRPVKSGAKIASAPKPERRPGKSRLSRDPDTQVSPANRAPDAPGKPAVDPSAADIGPPPVARPRTAPTKQPAVKASPVKSTKMRRMARLPAADHNSEAVNLAVAPGPDPKGPGATLPSPALIPARVSTSVGGAPAVGDERIPAKPLRKERKKLSAKFG